MLTGPLYLHAKRQSERLPHFSHVEFFIPLVDHSVALGLADVFDSISANSRNVSVPTED